MNKIRFAPVGMDESGHKPPSDRCTTLSIQGMGLGGMDAFVPIQLVRQYSSLTVDGRNPFRTPTNVMVSTMVSTCESTVSIPPKPSCP